MYLGIDLGTSEVKVLLLSREGRVIGTAGSPFSVSRPHPRWAERPVAYVVPKPEHQGQVTQEEILEFLGDKVAKWWLPDEVRFIGEIPKTSVGKFDKKVLRAEATPLAAGA